MTHTPCPRLAGGGLCPVLKGTFLLDEIFLVLRIMEKQNQFFEFLASAGVKFWLVRAQPRKIDGRRGAPLGARMGFEFGVPAARAAEAAAKLLAKLRDRDGGRRAKRGVDMVVTESLHMRDRRELPGRVLLLDDLDGIQVDEALAWWRGAAATIETSVGNHQVLLVSPLPLERAALLDARRGVVKRFGGDAGAVGIGQLHRFPGSENWKPALLEAHGQPFVTRLAELRPAVDLKGAANQVRELLAAPPAAPALVRPAPQAPGGAGAGDNSRQAFAWTCAQVRAGKDEDWLLEELWRLYGHSGHRREDWTQRTLRAARQRVAGVAAARLIHSLWRDVT